MFDQNSLDRRSFVKGAAAAAAASVAAGAATAFADAAAPTSDEAADAAQEQANQEVMDLHANKVVTDLEPLEPAKGTPVADVYQCQEDWLGSAPEVAEGDIVQTVDADVVVCGGGHAGVQCALAAAQAGAKVVVLEEQAEDSYTFYGDDICAYNSKWHDEHGFGGYDLGEITAEYIRRGAGRVSPEIIRMFVENSGEMLDNMIAQVPDTSNVFDIDNNECQVQTAYDMPDSSYYPLERGGFKAWATTIQTMGTMNEQPVCGRTNVSRLTEVELYCKDAAEKLGAQWLFETQALECVQDADGAVTGVIAKGPDGYIQVNAAKAVCLTTGDFAGNPDMIFNLLDDVNEMSMRAGSDRTQMTGAGRDGQGQKMGCWAGGVIESHPRPSMNTMGGAPGPWGTTPFLYLNAKGKRFMNECMAGYGTPEIARQPHGLVSAICDANWLESVQNAGLDHGAPNWGRGGVERAHMFDNLQAGMDAAVDAGAEGYDVPGVGIVSVAMQMPSHVFAAQTLDELLDYLGYEGDAKEQALASIEEYNQMCAAGKDTAFGKDPIALVPVSEPPFFGAVSQNTGAGTAGLVTLAGLVTDENLNVLASDYTTPIKGLYAAGNCLGHRFGPGYSTPSAGASMGMAMTHGRVLGKIVAAL